MPYIAHVRFNVLQGDCGILQPLLSALAQAFSPLMAWYRVVWPSTGHGAYDPAAFQDAFRQAGIASYCVLNNKVAKFAAHVSAFLSEADPADGNIGNQARDYDNLWHTTTNVGAPAAQGFAFTQVLHLRHIAFPCRQLYLREDVRKFFKLGDLIPYECTTDTWNVFRESHDWRTALTIAIYVAHGDFERNDPRRISCYHDIMRAVSDRMKEQYHEHTKRGEFPALTTSRLRQMLVDTSTDFAAAGLIHTPSDIMELMENLHMSYSPSPVSFMRVLFGQGTKRRVAPPFDPYGSD